MILCERERHTALSLSVLLRRATFHGEDLLRLMWESETMVDAPHFADKALCRVEELGWVTRGNYDPRRSEASIDSRKIKSWAHSLGIEFQGPSHCHWIVTMTRWPHERDVEVVLYARVRSGYRARR